MHWVDHPLTCYALLGTGLALCLYLFVAAKVELRAVELRSRKFETELRLELESLRSRVLAAENTLTHLEEQSGALVAPPPAPSGLNLSKRSQVLRRCRLGEDAARIASGLGIPRSEVDLLIKVNRLLVSQL